MPEERGPLALREGRRIHDRDQPGEAQAREQLGVEGIALVVRLGDRAQAPGVREHERDARPREELVQPRPRRTRLHHRVERAIRGEPGEQLLGLAHAHARGSGDALPRAVDDDHDDVPCVCIDTGEKHVGLLVGKRPW
jgi:hypothetical protein